MPLANSTFARTVTTHFSMTRLLIIVLTITTLACNPKKPAGSNSQEDSMCSEIILFESTLGDLHLNELNAHNIRSEIQEAFSDFDLKKKIGQQDGPDYGLYEISKSDGKCFYISMDSYDTTLVQDIWTKSIGFKDEYGVSVGFSVDSALKQRPNLVFYSDLHQNIYANVPASKISYRLTGDFKMLNDSAFVYNDFSVDKWQVEGMEVEYLIWKK